MPKGKADQNASILEYALRHLEMERDEIQSKIDHVRAQLGGSAKSSAAPVEVAAEASAAPGRKKRVLSPAARKRIALAQKRRWAEHRKAKAE
jgi:hypothetical protein